MESIIVLQQLKQKHHQLIVELLVKTNSFDIIVCCIKKQMSYKANV